jgi:tetratricopeptide (TPR) repeat protein
MATATSKLATSSVPRRCTLKRELTFSYSLCAQSTYFAYALFVVSVYPDLSYGIRVRQGRGASGQQEYLETGHDWVKLTIALCRIIADPKNPALYTNRAFARLKMSLWDSVITDCNQCLDLTPDNMKAHYYLSQAYLALHNYNDALDHAKRAHELCIPTNDKSLSSVTAQVLKCKKERWEDMDRRRRRESSELESEVVAMMERERDEALLEIQDDAEKKEVEAEWERKMAHMKSVFENARSADDRRRTVPDWAIDDISFQVMVDPVVVSFVPFTLLSARLLTYTSSHPDQDG